MLLRSCADHTTNPLTTVGPMSPEGDEKRLPWARIDDMLPGHPKVTSLSDAAFRLYISAICWSSMHRTDGHIPAAQLRFIAAPIKRPQLAVDQLVLSGLWEKNGNGWVIHDYLDYQPSAAKVKAEQEAKRKRQERWRQGRDASQDVSNDSTRYHQHALSLLRARETSHPIPSPSGSVVTNPAGSSGPPPDGIVIQAVQEAIFSRTGKGIGVDDARAAATRIMGNESVRNPAAYVSAAIMRDPNPQRFLPANIPPPMPPRRARPDQGDVNERGSQRAWAALKQVLPSDESDETEGNDQ